MCWVIQKLDFDEEIREHQDTGGRDYSFVYYLTEGDWNRDEGGILSIEGELEVEPIFNSIVFWNNKTLPKHYVSKNYNQKRIALVGFFSKPYFLF